MIGAKKISVA